MAPKFISSDDSTALVMSPDSVPPGKLPGGIFTSASRPTLSSRLGRLKSWHQPRRTAFVLAGGGSRGAAQVGMLDTLVRRGITPDAVYGCSVGALNAAGFANRPGLGGVEHLQRTWQSVTSADIFPQGRVPTPWKFVQQRDSVHSSDGLRRIIENGLAFPRIEQSPVPYEVVATSLEDGREKWFNSGLAVPAILASSALPALLPPVTVDGHRYIDGGVVNNVPLGRAIEQGAERVFVLLCGPLEFPPQHYRRPLEAFVTAFFIAMHNRFARELASLPHGVEVIVMTVGAEPSSRYNDFSQTSALVSAGRLSAERVLEAWMAGEESAPPEPVIASTESEDAAGRASP